MICWEEFVDGRHRRHRRSLRVLLRRACCFSKFRLPQLHYELGMAFASLRVSWKGTDGVGRHLGFYLIPLGFLGSRPFSFEYDTTAFAHFLFRPDRHGRRFGFLIGGQLLASTWPAPVLTCRMRHLGSRSVDYGPPGTLLFNSCAIYSFRLCLNPRWHRSPFHNFTPSLIPGTIGQSALVGMLPILGMRLFWDTLLLFVCVRGCQLSRWYTQLHRVERLGLSNGKFSLGSRCFFIPFSLQLHAITASSSFFLPFDC